MHDFKNIKVAVAGTGYVGLSIATLLAQHHHVTAVDVIPEKVEKLNRRVSPIQDDYIEKYLGDRSLLPCVGPDEAEQPGHGTLVATLDGKSAYADADFVVIAAPTNYDPVKNYFDTTHVEEVIDLVLAVNPNAVMIIKSTIPVGYTRSLYPLRAPGREAVQPPLLPRIPPREQGPLRQPLPEPHHRRLPEADEPPRLRR